MQIFLMSSEDGVFNSGVCWNSHVSKLNLWPGKLQDSEKIMTMSMSKSNNIQTLELFCSDNGRLAKQYFKG